MPSAENAKLDYESAQSKVAMVELTDSGDHLTFESADPIWSQRSGYSPSVKPNGLATGGAVTPAASGTNDLVDVAGLTCYLAGVLTTVVASTDETILRAAPADTHKISSIQITSGGAISIVAGADHTSFSETRDADGGPPYILVGSIEIAQVRLSANSGSPAAITADEIFQVVNTHQERYDFPTWEVNDVSVSNQVIGNAGVTFDSALPLTHTAAVPKKVYAEYYEPVFAQVPKASDFVPAETTHSVNSTQIYGSTIGAKSSSLGQGSFTAFLNDGISDGLLTLKDERLWFRFYADRDEDPYILTNGYLGISRTFPAGDSIQASCTISAEETAVEVVS